MKKNIVLLGLMFLGTSSTMIHALVNPNSGGLLPAAGQLPPAPEVPHHDPAHLPTKAEILQHLQTVKNLSSGELLEQITLLLKQKMGEVPVEHGVNYVMALNSIENALSESEKVFSVLDHLTQNNDPSLQMILKAFNVAQTLHKAQSNAAEVKKKIAELKEKLNDPSKENKVISGETGKNEASKSNAANTNTNTNTNDKANTNTNTNTNDNKSLLTMEDVKKLGASITDVKLTKKNSEEVAKNIGTFVAAYLAEDAKIKEDYENALKKAEKAEKHDSLTKVRDGHALAITIFDLLEKTCNGKTIAKLLTDKKALKDQNQNVIKGHLQKFNSDATAKSILTKYVQETKGKKTTFKYNGTSQLEKEINDTK